MSFRNWRGGKRLRGKETINHRRRKPQNCFYAAHNDIGDEAGNYYVYDDGIDDDDDDDDYDDDENDFDGTTSVEISRPTVGVCPPPL